MKKFLYKLLSIIIFLFINLAYANAANPELFVKLASQPDADYNNVSIDVVNNNNTQLNFKVQAVMLPGTTGNYSIAFPAGFEFVSNSINISNPACTGNNINTLDNSTFAFNITSIGSFCVYDFILTYKVTNSVSEGSKTISVINLNTSQITRSITLGVTTSNTLTNAQTIDSDNNGFIDKYKLIFSTGGLTNFSSSNLTVGGLTPTLDSISNNIAYINFNNSTYYSGEKPQILDLDGNIFSGIGIINEGTISEEDKASPVILKINGTNIVGVPNPIINISQNSKLVINFSEKILSNSLNNGFSIIENGVDITNSSYISFNENNGNTMYYCLGGYDLNGNCIINFDSNKSYSINIDNNTIDLNSNTYNGGSINININVLDSTPPIASSITYNSETNNGIIINGISGNNNYTNSSAGNVNLSILGNDNSGNIEKMCISEDSLLTNDNNCDTGWENYNISKTTTFTGIEGLKTIYIKFKDSAGNVSNIYNDSIIWDKSKPISSALPNGGYFNNGNINVSLNCSDSISNCIVIYYTTDGTIPTNSSSQISPGNTINISGNNETKTLKFFSKDIAGNQEATTNTKSFIFGDSYVSFTNPNTSTYNNNITLNGTCNYSLGINDIEYSINGSIFSNVTNDNCEINNTWSNDFILTNNSSNSIIIRLKNNISISSNINIIHDNIAPSSLNVSINNNDIYNSTNNVTLTISASDINGVNQMCISTDGLLTNDNNCNGSIWETYSNSKNYSFTGGDGSKTVYIKFKDSVGNISSVTSDSIIINSSIPTVSSNLASGNYTSAKTITLNSSGTIYYTLDGTTPTNSSTLYNSPITLGNNTGSEELKVISYGNSGLISSVSTYNYTFGCSPSLVTNGSVAIYPTCTITCNSGYTLSGNTCISQSNGGGGGGGGGIIIIPENTNNYEDTEILENEILEEENTSSGSTLSIKNKIEHDNFILKLKNNVKNEKILDIIDKLSEKLIIPEIYYYLNFDKELQTEYYNIVNGFYNYITNLDKYSISKNDNEKLLALNAYNIFIKINDLKNFEQRYITIENINNNEIYKTKYEQFKIITGKIQDIVLSKFQKLLNSNTISEEIYKKAIKDYNDFILYLTILKQYNYTEARNNALVSAKNFVKIYNLKIKKTQIETQNQIETKVKNEVKTTLIKDKYNFPKELNFGMYNIEVQNLQKIMKSYGYFNYETTMYFGNATKESLIKFSNEILKTPNSNGILSKDLIEKLYLIEYK